MRSSVLLVVLLVLLPFIVARSPTHLRFIDDVKPSTVSDDEAGGPIPFVTTSPATSAPRVGPTSTPPSPPSPPSPPVSPSEWTIRYLPPSYVATYTNTTDTGVVVNARQWPVAEVSARLTQHLTSHELHHQQKRLDRYVDRLQRRAAAAVNGSSLYHSGPHQHGDGDKKEHKEQHHGSKHYSDLSSFYLRHAQCGACVHSNLDLLRSTSRVALPAYAPYAMMKFCHNKQPLLPHELPPSASNPTPLQDWEGVCIPAESQCPATTVDLNVLSPSSCAGDVAATKHSCALCVLDGYTWTTHRRAVKGGDNYDGVCSSQSSVAAVMGYHKAVVVGELDECPSVVASAREQQRFAQVSGSFFLFFSFASALCCCLALRRCCQVRAKARVARLAAAQAAVEVPVAEPVVMQVAAAQPSSYPGRVAAAREVRQQAVAVAMQEPLLVSSGLNPPFYPQVSNPPPYANYPYRM